MEVTSTSVVSRMFLQLRHTKKKNKQNTFIKALLYVPQRRSCLDEERKRGTPGTETQ